MNQIRQVITLALGVTIYLSGFAIPAGAKSLRVCADPNYLPYSNRAGQGFENKIAESMAKYLGQTLEYTWANSRGDGGFTQFLAQTLDAGKCDVVMGIPYGSKDALTTHAYYVSSYVFIFKKSKKYDISDIDSPALKQLKVGFERDTQAESALKMRGMTDRAVPFDVGDDSGESPATLLKAVESGKVDVMITWQPAISRFLANYPDLDVVPVPNNRAMGSPEQYVFPIAMGVQEKNDALKQQLDEVIDQHKAELTSILDKFGVQTTLPPPANTQ